MEDKKISKFSLFWNYAEGFLSFFLKKKTFL